jgi:hypothetical protein
MKGGLAFAFVVFVFVVVSNSYCQQMMVIDGDDIQK